MTNSDDFIYGMTRDDWAAWRGRETSQPEEVELVEIVAEHQRTVPRLETHHSQGRFVATVARSYGDALFPETYNGGLVEPWMSAVVAGGDLVGFVMVALVTDHHPEPYLWRLLVDRMHQRRSIGRRIVDLVVGELDATGSTSLLTSWVDGPGSPRPFYERYGFVPTGEIEDGEVVARLVW